MQIIVIGCTTITNAILKESFCKYLYKFALENSDYCRHSPYIAKYVYTELLQHYHIIYMYLSFFFDHLYKFLIQNIPSK